MSPTICTAGTIYDPTSESCIGLTDIAAGQQAIADNQKRGASGLIGPGVPQSTDVTMGKYSFDSNPLTPPWVQMPDGGFPFSSNGTINLPAIGSGFQDVIGPNAVQINGSIYVFQVPNGNDGVIKTLVCFYNGGGFVSGSGALVWRILINGQAVRNYDNILVQLGVQPFPGNTEGIRVASGDTVQFQVSNISLIGATNQIFCFFGGWFYPSKLS